MNSALFMFSILVSGISSITIGFTDKSLQIENARRFRREVACNNEEFKCASGQCIPKNFTCDGIPHCDDNSDETEDLCSKSECPEHNYRCSYGACVSGNSQCNGIKECYDGSDEICSACPSIYNNSNRKVRCFYRNKELENCVNPSNDTIAELSCDEFYEFNTKSQFETLQCIDGMWNQTVPNCKPVCGKKSVEAVTSKINEEYVKMGDYPWQAALYTVKEKNLICGGSLISENIILTAAHCISRGSTSELLSKENIFVAVGKYYRNFSDSRDIHFQHSSVKEIILTREYRGSILNYLGDLAVIVTEKSFKLSKNVLPVCVDWKLDLTEEFSNPSSPGTVTGWGLTTETGSPSEILKELTVPYVQRKDCSLSFDYYQYLTHDKICAMHLNNGSSVCNGDSGSGLVFPNPTDHRYYVVGIVSISPRAPTEVGGCNRQNYGLYTKVSDYVPFMTSKTRLYGADRERCILLDHPKNGYWVVKEASSEIIYKPEVSVSNGTRISVHCKRGFDLEGQDEVTCNNGVWSSEIGICKASTVSCVLPKFPENGCWTALGFPKFTFAPGMLANEGSVIQVSCEKNSRVTGYETVFCHNGTWNRELGACLTEICPPIVEQKNMKVECSYNDVKIKNCTNPFDGVIAVVTCNKFYEISGGRGNRFTLFCKGGLWDRAMPTCVSAERTPGKISEEKCAQYAKQRSAGLSGDEPIVFSRLNEEIEGLEYPHMAVIVFDEGGTTKLQCGATLISEQYILTSGYCVTNININKEQRNYYVKLGVKSLNTLDEHTQRFNISKAITPSDYKWTSYYNDIGLIKLVRKAEINSYVKPACLYLKSEIEETRVMVIGYEVSKYAGDISENLRKVILDPSVKEEDCKKHYYPDDEFGYEYIFCAASVPSGHYNRSICGRNDGSPVQIFDENRKVFEIMGVSVFASLCRNVIPGVYERVSYHVKWIEDTVWPDSNK